MACCFDGDFFPLRMGKGHALHQLSTFFGETKKKVFVFDLKWTHSKLGHIMMYKALQGYIKDFTSFAVTFRSILSGIRVRNSRKEDFTTVSII